MWKLQRVISEQKSVEQVSNKHRNFRAVEFMFGFRHNLRKHFEGEIFECHCGSVYASKALLQNHKRIHGGMKTCGICQKEFANALCLRRHWRRKHQQTDGKFQDRKCRFCFLDYWNLLTFFLFSTKVKLLTTKGGAFICDNCGSAYQNRESFSAHFRNYHRSYRRYCDLCPKSFGHKCHLKRHIEHVHLQLIKLECFICNFKCFSERSLKLHLLRHGPKSECNICHKLVTNMKKHLRSHVNVNSAKARAVSRSALGGLQRKSGKGKAAKT